MSSADHSQTETITVGSPCVPHLLLFLLFLLFLRKRLVNQTNDHIVIIKTICVNYLINFDHWIPAEAPPDQPTMNKELEIQQKAAELLTPQGGSNCKL